MDGNRIGRLPSITPCQHHHDRNPLSPCFSENHLIPSLESPKSQLEPSFLVILIRVGPRDIDEKLRPEDLERRQEMP
jgi:hypothetical protein